MYASWNGATGHELGSAGGRMPDRSHRRRLPWSGFETKMTSRAPTRVRGQGARRRRQSARHVLGGARLLSGHRRWLRGLSNTSPGARFRGRWRAAHTSRCRRASRRDAAARRPSRPHLELYFAFDDPCSAVAVLDLALASGRSRRCSSAMPVVGRGMPDDPAVELKRRYAIVDARRLARAQGLELGASTSRSGRGDRVPGGMGRGRSAPANRQALPVYRVSARPCASCGSAPSGQSTPAPLERSVAGALALRAAARRSQEARACAPPRRAWPGAASMKRRRPGRTAAGSSPTTARTRSASGSTSSAGVLEMTHRCDSSSPSAAPTRTCPRRGRSRSRTASTSSCAFAG